MDRAATGANPRIEVQQQLHRLARKRLERFVTLVAKFLVNDDPDVIHDLRVASRRLQQTVRAVASTRRNSKTRKILKFPRRTRRAAGPCRNLDVNAAMIRDRLEQTSSKILRNGWNNLRERLQAERPSLLSSGRRQVAKQDLFSFAARARKFLATAEPPVHSALPTLRKAVQESLVAWDAACARAEASGSVEDLHALRIATKAFRYRAEILLDLGVGAYKTIAKDLKQLQSALGEWHDHSVFLQFAATCVGRPEYLKNNATTANSLLARIHEEQKLLDRAGRRIIKLAVKLRRGWRMTHKPRDASAAEGMQPGAVKRV